MTHDHYFGLHWRTVSFYPQPGCVVGCLPVPGAIQLRGTVTEVEPTEPAQPGSIPNAIVSVRGQSGRVLRVNAVEQYLRVEL